MLSFVLYSGDSNDILNMFSNGEVLVTPLGGKSVVKIAAEERNGERYFTSTVTPFNLFNNVPPTQTSVVLYMTIQSYTVTIFDDESTSHFVERIFEGIGSYSHLLVIFTGIVYFIVECCYPDFRCGRC